ncbi:MAG: hypothetical protein JXB35_05555 [Anaerolineae bacterium]|nr:hypothetical protein [Anaerolineae bacterium]
MSIFSRADVAALLEARQGPCVSIFMPTQCAGRETLQNPIRLKNRLAEVEALLEKEGLTPQDIAALLEPASILAPDSLFWQYQSDGLALFISPATFHLYRLPVEFDSMTMVADRFYIKPLLPLARANGQFYLLTLARDQIRLLQGTKYRMSEVEVRGMPAEIAALFREEERHLQFHNCTRVPGGRDRERPAIFHGHAVYKDRSHETLLRHFRQIDDVLKEILVATNAPLVLAGQVQWLPHYREVNTYEFLIDGEVAKDPTAMTDEELHAAAWRILEPHFASARMAAIERYRILQHHEPGRVSRQAPDIVRAAASERVDTLFVAQDLQVWGVFDPQRGKVSIHDTQEPGDRELLGFASAKTFVNEGAVHVLPAEDVPDGGEAAAIFRF